MQHLERKNMRSVQFIETLVRKNPIVIFIYSTGGKRMIHSWQLH